MILPFPKMTNTEFHDRLDELQEYYDNNDDIENGVFLKNKRYWYIWFDNIQYGYIDYEAVGAIKDGSCKNRITFLDSSIHFKCFGSIRTVPRGAIADNKKQILRIYARALQYNNNIKRLKRLEKTFPELVI